MHLIGSPAIASKEAATAASSSIFTLPGLSRAIDHLEQLLAMLTQRERATFRLVGALALVFLSAFRPIP
jgi:hypothetical protein